MLGDIVYRSSVTFERNERSRATGTSVTLRQNHWSHRRGMPTLRRARCFRRCFVVPPDDDAQTQVMLTLASSSELADTIAAAEQAVAALPSLQRLPPGIERSVVGEVR